MNVMWNSEKLEKTAKALLPTTSARVYAELNYALSSYGIDSGKALLILLGQYHTDYFMRQFYDGNGREFQAAWEKLQTEIQTHLQSQKRLTQS